MPQQGFCSPLEKGTAIINLFLKISTDTIYSIMINDKI